MAVATPMSVATSSTAPGPGKQLFSSRCGQVEVARVSVGFFFVVVIVVVGQGCLGIDECRAFGVEKDVRNFVCHREPEGIEPLHAAGQTNHVPTVVEGLDIPKRPVLSSGSTNTSMTPA